MYLKLAQEGCRRGSGPVPGLKELIKTVVVQAFEIKGFTADTARQIKLQGAQLPDLSFKAEAEYARRAVCLGATDKDGPGCAYLQAWNVLSLRG